MLHSIGHSDQGCGESRKLRHHCSFVAPWHHAPPVSTLSYHVYLRMPNTRARREPTRRGERRQNARSNETLDFRVYPYWGVSLGLYMKAGEWMMRLINAR